MFPFSIFSLFKARIRAKDTRLRGKISDVIDIKSECAKSEAGSLAASFFLFASFMIPLNEQGAWQVLKYRKLVSNKVMFSASGLEMKVSQSASPVIYPLPKVQKVRGVRILGRVTGHLNIPKGTAQGDQLADDYQVRVGFVLKGQKRLNPIQKMLAADWIVKLYELAPPEVGIDKIYFLKATQIASSLGRNRKHPVSDLIEERVLWRLPEDGDFALDHRFSEIKEVLALWLSSDGDDTKSEYLVQISKLELDVDGG
ncbi:MAG: hypothetical protein IPJ71_06510 [Bdellovibrionales bacterium]|nr:hypothetical protein [Bdellovibrionales bacterium]